MSIQGCHNLVQLLVNCKQPYHNLVTTLYNIIVNNFVTTLYNCVFLHGNVRIIFQCMYQYSKIAKYRCIDMSMSLCISMKCFIKCKKDILVKTIQ